MSFSFVLQSDAWPRGEETVHVVPQMDSFWVKFLIIITVIVVIIALVRSLNKFRTGGISSMKTDLSEFLGDELILEQELSLRRIIIYFSIVIFLVAIPLYFIVHIGIAFGITILLSASLGLMVVSDYSVGYSRVVINRIDRTVTLSSLIGNKVIKPEVVQPFEELLFNEYYVKGRLKYALYIGEPKDSSDAIWDGFTADEVRLILDWARKTSVETFEFKN